MEYDLAIKPGLVIPGSELELVSSRASGPGGQHVNKTNSRISLRWNLENSLALTPFQRARITEKLAHRISKSGDIQVDAEQHRSQLKNREMARERLAHLLRKALERPKKRKATRPSRASKERRLKSKKRRSDIKASRNKSNHD